MEFDYFPDPMTRLEALGPYSALEEINFKTKVEKQQRNHFKEIKTNEKNCSICQQKKKRILSHYIKGKQIDRKNSATIEEEEEEEELKEQEKPKNKLKE